MSGRRSGSGDEMFMGRWRRLVAVRFVDTPDQLWQASCRAGMSQVETSSLEIVTGFMISKSSGGRFSWDKGRLVSV